MPWEKEKFMKRKQLIAVGILCICLFASACGSNTTGTEQGAEDTTVVQEKEAQKTDVKEKDITAAEELTEQDKIWLEFLENLYVHEDIAILTMGDKKTFMEKVDEELEQKPEWENNIYYEQSDGTGLMYNAYDNFESYTVRSAPYNEFPPYYSYDYTLIGFDEGGEMSEIRTRIMYFDEEKRYTSDAIGGFCDFIDKYNITTVCELLQTLGLWNDKIENAFQSETKEDYVEYFDTYYGKVRVAVRTDMVSVDDMMLKTTVALSFAADSSSPFQTIYLNGESGYDKNYDTYGMTVDAYLMTEVYRAYVSNDHKEASIADAEEAWQLLADMENKSFATYNPWGQTWQDFKETLENAFNITFESEQEIPLEKERKIRFWVEFMGHDLFTYAPIPTGTEFMIGNDYFNLMANYDYDSDMFMGYSIGTENAYCLALLSEDDMHEMGSYLEFCSNYAVIDVEDFLITLGIGTDFFDELIESSESSGTTMVQTPYGEASLRIGVKKVGDYSEMNQRIEELGELNLQMEVVASGGMTLDGTPLDGEYTDAELFELFGLGESAYITVAEPMTKHNAITLYITFPEGGDAPIRMIELLAWTTDSLDGLKYGKWQFSVYINN